jgi:hypothetical protein
VKRTDKFLLPTILLLVSSPVYPQCAADALTLNEQGVVQVKAGQSAALELFHRATSGVGQVAVLLIPLR